MWRMRGTGLSISTYGEYYTRTRANVHIKMQFNFAVNCTEIVFCVGFRTGRRHTTYIFWRAQLQLKVGHKSLGARAIEHVLIIIYENALINVFCSAIQRAI